MSRGDPAQRLVCIGRVVGAWGVDGWLKVHSFTRDRTDLFEYGGWQLDTGGGIEAYELESGREQGRGLIAKLRGVDGRDGAARLLEARILVTGEQLPALADGEYFWHQLEGLRVETADGSPLGTVDYLFETGANDVMVIRGDRERLIPYNEEVVREVDLEAGVMRVDWDADF